MTDWQVWDLARVLFRMGGNMRLAAVVLAAGQGVRMKSKLPKVLHPLAGRPLITHVLEAARQIGADQLVVVLGYRAEAVRAVVGEGVTGVVQEPQLGTGHAVLQARPVLEGQCDTVLVLYGDMPLLRAETLRRLVERHHEGGAAITLLTVVSDDPQGFGRILRNGAGQVLGIVEETHATKEQLAIRELNCGIYCFRASWLWAHLPQLSVSPKGEYYLTDMVGLAVAQGLPVEALPITDRDEVLGINTRVHLAQAEAVVRQRICERHMLNGVTILDPASTFIDDAVEIGADTVIYPWTILAGRTRIGEGCQIGPGMRIVDATLGDGCVVQYSVLEECVLEAGVDVGPFSHLRAGAYLEAGVHIGNFGEVKRSRLGRGVKMGHFSYVGDAEVGPGANIGAGTITCNYDGQRKHTTEIGEGAFIGSDTMLVAPVRVGKGAKIGAGSVVTHDVPDGAVAYGVPARVKSETSNVKSQT